MCEPILRLLRFADSDVPSSSKIHYYAYKVQQQLQAEGELDEEVLDAVRDIWQDRWAMMSSPLHGAAYCFDPEFLSDPGLAVANQTDACVSDLLALVRKLVPAAAAALARQLTAMLS